MRIGIVCYPTTGGSGVVAAELGKGLARMGHEVHFIAYAMPFRLQQSTDSVHFHKVNVPRYPLFRFPPYDSALASIAAEIAECYGLQILHVHYAVPHAISAYLTKQMVGPALRTVTTLHGTDITLTGVNPSLCRIVSFSINMSDAVTAVSWYLVRAMNERFSLGREVSMIHNFIDTGYYKRQRKPFLMPCLAPNGEKLVVHMSNFRPVKRTPLVVEIFSRVRKHLPAKLVMVGSGPDLRKAEAAAERFGVHDDVLFVGTQNNIVPLLSVADLFLLPSDEESFGLSALEAMSCEVPVVASRVGGLPEVVTHGVTGYLPEKDDLDGMVTACLEILCDSERGRAMGYAGRQSAIRRFDASILLPKYEQLYRELL